MRQQTQQQQQQQQREEREGRARVCVSDNEVDQGDYRVVRSQSDVLLGCGGCSVTSSRNQWRAWRQLLLN